ncbi:serine/threonine-protein kinase [Hamadaea sp. NPDC051192]|uniref:serine/threonine-protein kinase n=1 Tax=Hamadaea sp. NPDC051192 TaxID=3154940 RepID=UPI00341F6CF7
MWLPVGTALGGRYVLTGRLAMGGVSHVYRAVDSFEGKARAVKCLSGRGRAYSVTSELLRNEAMITTRLRHPNVPRLYDYGDAALADGSTIGFMVLELLQGESLSTRMERRTLLPWPEVARIGGSVADVLAVAHRRGVTHRDLNPDNVMLTPVGVKIIDYGLAEATEDGLSRAEDVYSLGVLVYRMLTGSSPYQTRSIGRPRRGVRPKALAPAPVLAVPGLPGGITDLVRACMDKNPARRPSAREVSITLWSLVTV